MLTRRFFFFQIVLFFSISALSQDRVEGFKKHLELNQKYDLLRKSGFEDWKDAQKKWELYRKKAAHVYRTQEKTAQKDQEIQKDFENFQIQKKKAEDVRTQNLQKYSLESKKREEKVIKEDLALQVAGEFDSFSQRPRYKLSKRALYGAKPRYKPSLLQGSAGGGDSSVQDYDYQPAPVVPPPTNSTGFTDEFNDLNSSPSRGSIPYDQQMDMDYPPPYFPEEEAPPPPNFEFDDGF